VVVGCLVIILVSWRAEIKNVYPFIHIKTGSLIVFVLVLIGSFVLAAFSYRVISAQQLSTVNLTVTAPVQTPTSIGTPTTNFPPVVSPSAVLGIVADAITPFKGIPWVRISYVTCISTGPHGQGLKATIAMFHRLGVRVMLTICQWANDARLYDTTYMNDVARAGADAVQCGNEQMKIGRYNLGVPPGVFAKFYDLCQQAVRAVRPEIPVIIGSNDPHVGGIDYAPLVQEVGYFNAMQYAMNTSVHPGGNWTWRSQIIGLIDSWHNGYPNQATNSLYGLFAFWARQFGVDLNSGGLGNHLWVIEGTGCIFGCGIDASSAAVVAISHILTLTTDVQTTMRYKVPFFYFSARDFASQGAYWPMGVRDGNGRPKPLRQDLAMGARTLNMACAQGKVVVSSQEQLLASLYNGCALPNNYISILTG
jgi:hypothetical protein